MCHIALQQHLPSAQCQINSAHRFAPNWLVIMFAAWAVIASGHPVSTVLAQTPPDTTSDADAAERDLQPVDFVTDIEPIFVAHCLKCHGPQRRSGGLRLDARKYAAAGGDTGGAILGGPLDSSELYQRVSSSERTYRMPKNAEALSAEQLDRLRRWIIQGAPWPTADGDASGAGASGFYDSLLVWFGDLADRYQFEYQYALPYAVVFVVAQFVLFALARARRAYRNHRPWATGRFRWLGKFASQLSVRELTLAWCLLVGALIVVVMFGHQRKLGGQLAKAERKLAKTESPWTKTVFGWPPVPVRPDHPRQVSGTYYRGNCERNPELFNGGNYLTAMFHISLCDADGGTVGIGDALPAGGLFVRLEIERAPGTPDQLFSDDLMAAVFLSTEFYGTSSGQRRDDPVTLENLEEGQRWVARVPIGKPLERASLAGLIYLYTGRVDGDSARGDPHYGIKYDLQFHEDRLTDESDLWMNSLGNPLVAEPTPADKIPFREWFDHRPIPAITGENSKDPKLLGVEEYVEKGLISPDAKGTDQPDSRLDDQAKPPADTSPAPQEDESRPRPKP